MARGTVGLRSRDGGIGYTGPIGVTTWAALGVASKAEAIADQEPIAVTSADDVEELFGFGPLRDLLVTALSAAGTTVIVVPLQRNAGGARIGTGSLTDGSLIVSAIGGHSLGGQEVALEVVTAGAAGAAAFRLVVNGQPQPSFSPAAADFSSAIDLTEAQLGPLADGVATTDYMTVTITTGTFVLGDRVTWRMGQPTALGADMAPAVEKIVSHAVPWEFVAAAGVTTPATWSLLDTAVRALPSRGRYVHAHVMALGPDARTGGSSATTAAWVSAGVGATAPTRQEDPRLFIWHSYATMRDAINNRAQVYNAMYPSMGAIAARQPWEPPDGTEWGPLQGVEAIYPTDMTDAHVDALDDVGYCTLTTYPGEEGVYITHCQTMDPVPVRRDRRVGLLRRHRTAPPHGRGAATRVSAACSAGSIRWCRRTPAGG